MNRLDGPLANNISQTAQNNRARRNLCVAVLGPTTNPEDHNFGSKKRQQIYDALATDGHRPFFPEQLIELNEAGPNVLEQEESLLEQPHIDLVIILHTDSFGVPMEIAHFSSSPEIMAKTTILFPRKFYLPKQNVPSNVVSRYPDPLLYSDRQFQECSLVEECQKLANEMSLDHWLPFLTEPS